MGVVTSMTPPPVHDVDWRPLARGITLVATDLDGTLLRPDSSVSAFTVETLARARSESLPVVFVTGRPPRWIPPVVALTGHGGTGIAANGAVVLDLATNTVLEAHTIGADVLDEVVATLRAEVPGIGFAVEWVGGDDTDFAYEDSYHPRWPAPEAARTEDVRRFSRGHRVVKLLGRVTGSSHDADAFLDLALGHVEHLVTVTHSNSDDVLIEMSAPGVSKGAALAALATRLGVPSEQVAAAGDMPNDLPMLAWAGVGLGVGAAHPAVLAVADAVLPPPEQDGVARFVDAVLEHRSA
jgi:Cof subfamily protein (haloacid dehalogenase superfamily)